ncbi:hypothetical protein PG996_015648 [Apiospora saccharicola]|uniref:Uncharacterized protein n=1 Tax=Apiospora saccharicola TaxID=335842 RepID=A0ABR1TPF5_9PEZI
MEPPRPTADVSLAEIFGSSAPPYLTSDPRSQAAFKEGLGTEPQVFGAGGAKKHQAYVEDDPDNPAPLCTNKYVPSSSDSDGTTLLDGGQHHRKPQPQIPTDLKEEDYVDYPHLQTREWQLHGHPLLSAAEEDGTPEHHLDHAAAGGDPRLNQWDKIIPHAFLDSASAVPEHKMEEFPRLAEVVEAHLTGTTTDPVVRQTPCSSWSQSPQVALRYAGGPDDGSSRVAILDTTRLRPWNTVYNVSEMRYKGWHRLPLRWGCWEYLIYGPIEGSCLYTFPRQNLADLWRPDFGWSLYVGAGTTGTSSQLRPEVLQNARAIATLFVKRPGWEGERGPILIYLVVLLVASWRHSHRNPPADLRQDGWTVDEIRAIHEELLPELSQSWDVGLVSSDFQRVGMGYKWFRDALNLMRNIDLGALSPNGVGLKGSSRLGL